MFSKILVPLDLEDASRPGLDVAAALARESGALLLATHVLNGASIDVSEVPHEFRPLRAQAEQKASRRISDMLEESASGLSHQIHLFFGDPSDEIVKAARDLGADLIVVTVKNRSRLGKLLMGSQTQEIILSARVPVLCVPKSD